MSTLYCFSGSNPPVFSRGEARDKAISICVFGSYIDPAPSFYSTWDCPLSCTCTAVSVQLEKIASGSFPSVCLFVCFFCYKTLLANNFFKFKFSSVLMQFKLGIGYTKIFECNVSKMELLAKHILRPESALKK